MSERSWTVDQLAALSTEVALEISARMKGDPTWGTGTFKHDNPDFAGEREKSPFRALGRRRYEQKSHGTVRRFRSKPVSEPVDRQYAGVHPGHPAIREAHTIFPGQVAAPASRVNVLVPGINSMKTGSKVTKGPWAGMPIFTLTLEERATCPRSCVVFRECYGNAMPFAIRIKHGPSLMNRLDSDLRLLNAKHPRGFVVRLHVLGDFVDAAYAAQWIKWIETIPALRVWGYTAHPKASPVGLRIVEANQRHPDRWAVRFSVAPEAALGRMQAAVIWTKPEGFTAKDRAVICPQETGKTDTCGSCGLCWEPDAKDLRIVFMGHGRERATKPTTMEGNQ